MSYPWFRLYSEILGDRKTRSMARQAKTNTATVLGFEVMVLCLASDSPERGVLRWPSGDPFTYDQIAAEASHYLELDYDLIAEVWGALRHERVVGITPDGVYYLINWDKRQFPSDHSTPRVERYRERQRNNPETLQKRYEKRFRNAPEADTDTESEGETNTEREAEGAAGAGVAAGDGSSNPIYVSDEWVPEVYQHPDIILIEKITGTIPPEGEVSKILGAVQMIRNRYEQNGDALETYLTRFWLAWRGSKNKNGKRYNPLNYAWLYEWALNDHIPDYGQSSTAVEQAEKERAKYADWGK